MTSQSRPVPRTRHPPPPGADPPGPGTPSRPAPRHAGIPPAMHAGIAPPKDLLQGMLGYYLQCISGIAPPLLTE